MPDGQKVAKRLSSQITKEGRAIRGLLDEYSVCKAADDSTNVLTLQEALDPCIVGERLEEMGLFCETVASGKKREMIDSYLLLCRSKEEIVLLQKEAKNMAAYYSGVKQTVEDEITKQASSDLFGRGAVALLHKLLQRITLLLAQANELLKVMCGEGDSLLQGDGLDIDSEDSDSECDYSSDES